MIQLTKTFFLIIACSFWSYMLNAKSNSMLENTSACAVGNLTLNIQFDDHPEEITWTIRNPNGNILMGSGNTYANTTPYASVTENIPYLPDGDYILSVHDNQGNGLCCNGSYALSDSQGVLISGSNFAFSDVQQFCIGTSNGFVLDMMPPSAPMISTSNPTTNSVDLTITPATDNVAVTSYAIFQNDEYVIGLPQGSQLSFTTPWTLQPNTNYSYKVLAQDAVGNISAFGNISTISTLPAVMSTTIHEGYFETGLDGWIDGGVDCKRVKKSARSFEGDYSVRLRDNSGVASSMTLSNIDLTAYNSVDFEFQYYIHSFENNEDFWLMYHDGNAWTTIATYSKGADFSTNGFYSASISLDASNYNFPANAQFRLQCDASGNKDHVYIDQVIITGYGNSPTSPRLINPTHLDIEEEGISLQNNISIDAENRKSNENDFSQITIFPNPASHRFLIKGIDSAKIKMVYLMNLNGQLIKSFKGRKTEFHFDNVVTGMYLVVIELEDGHRIAQKMMVQNQ